MLNVKPLFYLTLFISATRVVVGQPTSTTSRVDIDSAAPRFEVQDAQGVQRSTMALNGKKALLLTFFPKCFTFNCKNQLTSLRDSYEKLQKSDVEVWAVSIDPAEGAKGQKAFAKHLKLQYPLIPDPHRKICLLYGAVQAPNQMAARMSVLIDKDGKVRWIDKQVDPRHHGEDVLEKLRELEMIPMEKASERAGNTGQS